MNDLVLNKESNDGELKEYFCQLLRLTEQNEMFPVDLLDVWMLVYARKDHAVRDLTQNFIQGVDYQLLPKKGENPNTGRPVDKYYLSVSCMEYFIARKVRPVFEIYRRIFHKAVKILAIPQTFAEALQLAADQAKQLESQNKAIEEMKPKAIFADSVSASSTSILIGDLAKIIHQNGCEMGQKRLFKWLRDNKYLISRAGSDYNSPTQTSMDKGLFFIKETDITHSDGHITVNKTVKVTGAGQIYFINKFTSKNLHIPKR